MKLDSSPNPSSCGILPQAVPAASRRSPVASGQTHLQLVSTMKNRTPIHRHLEGGSLPNDIVVSGGASAAMDSQTIRAHSRPFFYIRVPTHVFSRRTPAALGSFQITGCDRSPMEPILCRRHPRRGVRLPSAISAPLRFAAWLPRFRCAEDRLGSEPERSVDGRRQTQPLLGVEVHTKPVICGDSPPQFLC